MTKRKIFYEQISMKNQIEKNYNLYKELALLIEKEFSKIEKVSMR